MIPLNPWEHQNAFKALDSKYVSMVCQRYNMTRAELDILLFLANNPCYDTAAEIVEIRYLAKSQVSSSVKTLEQRGMLFREYAHGNRKTAHLKLCEKAMPIVREGQLAQEQCLAAILKGFSSSEIETLEDFSRRIQNNIDSLMEDTKC